MSIKTIKALTAVVLGAVSLQSFALAPSAGSPQLTLYIPGSQANDPAFGFLITGNALANAVCLDNPSPTGLGKGIGPSGVADAVNPSGQANTTTHIYFHDDGTGAKNDNYSAVYCLTNNTKIPGLSTGATNIRLLISRRRLGASYVGLDAVSHNKQLTYLGDPSTASCTATNASYTSAGVAYGHNYKCTTLITATATAATSDIGPDVYHGTDNITPNYGSNVFQEINTSDFTNIKAIAGHIIGIPVTLKLRNALQYAGIQSGSIPASCTVGNETATCQPSFSKEQLVSIFSGQIADWSTFKYKVGAASLSLPDVVAQGVTAAVPGLSNPADTTVHICRRENGAGQQVAMLANLFQSPCLGDSSTPQATPDTNFLLDVGYATSLGAVDNCLKDYNDGTNGWFGKTNPAPYPQPPATTVPHGNQWAISIQTTERNMTNAAPYRFIKIDGASPTVEQVYLGKYPLVGEYALSWKATGDADKALKAIAAYSGQPAVIAARNSAAGPQAFGQAGYISLSANGFTPPDTFTLSNPVTPYTRSVSGSANNCAVPVINPDYSTAEHR